MRPLLFILLTCLMSAPAWGENGSAKAQKIIEDCKQKSKSEWDSGITSRMMNGSYQYIDCIHKAIIFRADTYFIREEDKEKFIEHLDQMTENAYGVNYLIANGGCSPCGTMYRPIHIMHTAKMLEDALINMNMYADEHGRDKK